mmetsp:Transcript_109888/g.236499  ORF Transcript_109888/g.236499 Transcript_109888/m.236499 type:complete len:670 (-) Transcript_109888:55-2064(-)
MTLPGTDPQGPLNQSQYQSLFAKAEAQLNTDKRLEQVERTLGGVAACQDQLREAIDEALSDVRRHVEEEGLARQASIDDLKASSISASDVKALRERVVKVEELMGPFADRLARGIASIKGFQGKLDQEVEDRRYLEEDCKRRLDSLSESIRSAIAKHDDHVVAVDSRHGKTELLVDGGFSRAEKAREELRTQIQEEAETRVKLQEFAKTRVNYVEAMLREMTDKHSKDMLDIRKKLGTFDSRLSDARDEQLAQHQSVRGDLSETHEAHEKTTLEHVGRLEEVIKGHSEVHSKSRLDLESQLRLLQRQVAEERKSREEVLQEIQEVFQSKLTQQGLEQASELSRVKVAHAKLMALESKERDQLGERLDQRLDTVEADLLEAVNSQAAELQELKARLAQSAEQWSESLKVERSTRETTIASLVAQEREARESLDVEFRDRFQANEQTTKSLGDELSERRRRDLQSHADSLAALEQRLNHETANVRGHVTSERSLRAQHHDSVSEQISIERRAREALEKSTQQSTSQEKQARKNHEALLRRHLERIDDQIVSLSTALSAGKAQGYGQAEGYSQLRSSYSQLERSSSWNEFRNPSGLDSAEQNSARSRERGGSAETPMRGPYLSGASDFASPLDPLSVGPAGAADPSNRGAPRLPRAPSSGLQEPRQPDSGSR